MDYKDKEYENGLRKLGYCVGCGEDKEKGLVVCWECFKARENPLKSFIGSVYEWLVSIGKIDGIVGIKKV